MRDHSPRSAVVLLPGRPKWRRSLNPQADCTSTTVEPSRPIVLSLRWLPFHYYAAKNTFGGIQGS